MTRTIIDTDDELLRAAQAILGTKTKKETVNGALREVVALAARRQFIDDAQAGQLADLADPTVMSAAWRQ